jgi:predicted RNase H-like nuclease (RuvC/YqgF family)
MENKITLSYSEQQEVELFCKLNNITIDDLIKKSFKTGYNIEKYGLVGKTFNEGEKQLIKEVIVEKIVEVPVDRVVIKEVPVEKIVTIYDNNNENELSEKIVQLENEKKEFSTKIEELESKLQKFSTKMTEMENNFQNNDNSQQLQSTIQTLMKSIRDKNIEIEDLKKQLAEQQKNNDVYERAKYLRSSNLDDNLYK